MMNYNLDQENPKKSWALIGFPWDMGASLGRPGARYAPQSIREACQWNLNRIRGGRLWDLDRNKIVDLGEVRIEDLGDIPLAAHDTIETFAGATEFIGRALEAGQTPIILGGDHSISFPGIRALAERGPVGIIQLDAHLDLVDDSPSQGRYSQSSQIRRALELPGAAPGRVVQIGLRGINYPEYKEYAEEVGIHQITAAEAMAMDPKELAQRALEWAGQDGAAIYFTLDIDVLDPAVAPGAGALEFGGLSVPFVSEILRVCGPQIAAFDLAEVNPLFDHQGMTSQLAAKLIFDLLISCC
ncbi:MAG: arginase family protein [Limnochordia bacterium]|jgi:agmatinase